MTSKNDTFCYSDKLIEETRQAIYDMPLTMDDHLHFKKHNDRFGKISIFDLMADKLLMKNKPFPNDTIVVADYLYASADELIEAGWVID